MCADEKEREALQEIINNTKLNEGYLALARDIEVMELKSPDDIYKAHLLDGRGSGGGTVDSARQNFAATFVNEFVNAGFGQVHQKHLVVVLQQVGSSKIKNMEKPVPQLVWSRDCDCNVKNDCDPALALLAEYVDKEDSSTRIGAIMGLGLAYAVAFEFSSEDAC